MSVEELRKRDCIPFELGRGQGPPVLLIHGFTGSPGEMRPLGEALSRMGFWVRAVLLPGHCTSPEDLEGVRWEEWARKVEEEYVRLSDDAGKQPFVSGLSLGGALTLYLAEKRKVPAIAPIAAPVELPRVLWVVKLLSRAKRFVRARPKVRYEVPHYSYDRVPLRAVAEVLEFVGEVRKGLSLITSPALIVQGALDEVISPKNAEIIYREIRSAEKEMLLLERSHHVVTLDVEREEASRKIGEFFLRHYEGVKSPAYEGLRGGAGGVQH